MQVKSKMKRPFVWQMIREAVDNINGNEISYSQIKKYLKDKWGFDKATTINDQIAVVTVNHHSRIHYNENGKPRLTNTNSNFDFLYSIARGRVVKYKPDVHGVWEIFNENGRKGVRLFNETIVKIYLPLATKLGTSEYAVIYIPKEYRELFPAYKEDFILQTDIGEIQPHITSKSPAFPQGCNMQGGLTPWFKKHKLTSEDCLVIEIIKPLSIYKLSVVKGNEEYNNSENGEVISRTESGRKVYLSVAAERDSRLRKDALRIHGYICKGCGFDFEKTYGEKFIEVHHIIPLHSNNFKEVKTNPETDLTVLCANCHRVVHRKRGLTLSIDELKR